MWDKNASAIMKKAVITSLKFFDFLSNVERPLKIECELDW